jgi:hypothetical protein
MSSTGVYGTNFVQIIAAWILAIIFFAALVRYISEHSQKKTTLLKTAFVILYLCGMALYCYCHYRGLMQVINGAESNTYLQWVDKNNNSWFHHTFYYIPYVVMRSVMDVGMMFCGWNDCDVFYALPESNNPLNVVLFWLLHMIAFFMCTAALLIRFGNDLLRWIRIMTSRTSHIDIVFGVNNDSVAFGSNISDMKGRMLVYVDSIIGEEYETSIGGLGGLTYSDKDAVKATASFLKKLRIKPQKTSLRLYAFSSEYDRNLHYAQMMSESLENYGMLPDLTELVLLGTEEWKGIIFQSSETQYGYGNVMSFDEHEMSSRLLMYKYPLCNAIDFDENGRAAEDVNVLIVGFGRIGHEVLRKVIANGQFEGSSFHATIWDPNFEHRVGFFRSQYPKMFANYDISFEPYGGRGSKIFSFIHENAQKLNYIVICLDNRDTARDIAVQMIDRLRTLGYSKKVYTCDSKSVRCYSQYIKECETHWIYDSELLYSGELDKYAMELNHRYTGGKNAHEDWKHCDYFGRMSSRASVDYLIPLIRRIKTKMNTDTLTDEQRENLAKSEHLRWCAFHYTCGYDAMDKEEFIRRVKNYQDEIMKRGSSRIKVTKDSGKMLHVCLVDWDELDEISGIENSITNGSKDYKASDRANVDMVAELM